MANLSQIARVVIALSTASIAKASFGIPLIVAPTTGFSERVRIYTDPDAAIDDGLDARTLKAINSVFGQSPRPDRVYVGRRNLETVAITTGLTSVTAGNVFSLDVDGATYAYVAKSGDTITQVFTGLSDALKASGSITSKYAIRTNEASIDIEPLDSTQAAVIKMGNNLIHTPQGDPNNIAADLVAIKRENNDFYGLMLTERGDNMLMQTAIWTETQSKLFFACSGNPDIWDASKSDDIASLLQQQQYYRTALIAHKEADDEFPEAAWMGRCFSIQPGGEVWALKNLTGITPSNFSDTEQQVIWRKGANTYEKYSENVYMTNPGKVSAGEWIDTIRGRDFAVDTIQKDMASAQIRAKKIPYTNAGIQICVNTVRGSLVKLQKAGVLAPDEVNSDGETVPGFVISYPNAADVDANTKATRKLYLTFVGILAGAIQVTDITGSLAYNYEGA